MDKYTIKNDEEYEISPEFLQKAAQRLYNLEIMTEKLTRQNLEISAQLEALRLENKQKNYKFRELLGQKLINENVLNTLKLYKVE